MELECPSDQSLQRRDLHVYKKGSDPEYEMSELDEPGQPDLPDEMWYVSMFSLLGGKTIPFGCCFRVNNPEVSESFCVLTFGLW